MKEALEPGSNSTDVVMLLICKGSTMCLEIKGSLSFVTPPCLMSITLTVNSSLSSLSFFALLASAFSG